LRLAKQAQNEADQQMGDVQRALNRTQAAYDAGLTTWNDAQDSLDALTRFDTNVDANKDEALAELGKLSDIEKELRDAEQKTREAEQGIGDARLNANQALKIGEEASSKAEELSTNADKLKTDAANVKDGLDTQRKAIEDVIDSINKLGNTTKDFENQAISDSARSAEVLRKASTADNTAKNLQAKLKTAEGQLTAARDQLNSLEDVNDDQLASLEKLLDEAESQYQEAELDRLVKQEKNRVAENEKVQLKREMDTLNKELANLKSIYESLPSKCYNKISLEQEGNK
jgi:chromosome segregation ATPase